MGICLWMKTHMAPAPRVSGGRDVLVKNHPNIKLAQQVLEILKEPAVGGIRLSREPGSQFSGEVTLPLTSKGDGAST